MFVIPLHSKHHLLQTDAPTHCITEEVQLENYFAWQK